MPSKRECAGMRGPVVRNVGAVPMRILFLSVLAAALLPGVLHGQRPVAQPGPLAARGKRRRPLERTAYSCASVRTQSGPGKPQTITSQSIVVRVYHREDGHETWGWYGDNGAVSSIFDGARLRVVGLDATFHADTQRWSGTWLLDGETRDVVLERPRPAPGSTPHRLCGDWEGYRTRPG